MVQPAASSAGVSEARAAGKATYCCCRAAQVPTDGLTVVDVLVEVEVEVDVDVDVVVGMTGTVQFTVANRGSSEARAVGSFR